MLRRAQGGTKPSESTPAPAVDLLTAAPTRVASASWRRRGCPVGNPGQHERPTPPARGGIVRAAAARSVVQEACSAPPPQRESNCAREVPPGVRLPCMRPPTAPSALLSKGASATRCAVRPTQRSAARPAARFVCFRAAPAADTARGLPRRSAQHRAGAPWRALRAHPGRRSPSLCGEEGCLRCVPPAARRCLTGRVAARPLGRARAPLHPARRAPPPPPTRARAALAGGETDLTGELVAAGRGAEAVWGGERGARHRKRRQQHGQAAENAKSRGSRLRRGAALPSNPRARWVT